MKKILFFSICLLVISCASGEDENQITEPNYTNDQFSLNTDSSWKLRNLQGIDSYVGYYYKNNDTIRFDCGWYGFDDLDNIQSNPAFDYYEETVIDNCKSKIILCSSAGNQKILSLYIEKENDSLMKNVLYIKNPSNFENMVDLFKTHKFK